MTTELSRAGRVYVTAVILCGIGVVLDSLYELARAPVQLRWFVLAGLTLLSGSFTVRIPSIPARLSVSETFVFTAVLLFGPHAATVIVVLDSLIISLWLKTKTRRAERVLFNMSAPAIAIWVSAHLFFRLAGIRPLAEAYHEIVTLILPLFALALAYFLLNSVLIAVAVAFERRTPAHMIWRQNFLWLSLNYFSGASVAALLLPLVGNDTEFIRVIGVILPLLLISYLTFKTALGRVEDANSHLRELNHLYLSTIETLAMAIDAKDQITHGHIRRVQTYAVKLAKAMGVTDPKQIQAIEAAALLHDMGKLAVPEYILNKPGPLTPAEFDKMKLHASVGADILSAIEFPYPVVPIVRHHHENWDGTGYPTGISGSDIPIGARILSVVDCFDALTSDRPYRPRLKDEDAIRILLARRGNMYDPLAVDTFVRIHDELDPGVDPNEAEESDALGTLHSLVPPMQARRSEGMISKLRFEQIAATRSETAAMLEFARDIASVASSVELGEATMRHLRGLIPFVTAGLFVKTEDDDDLSVIAAAGSYIAGLEGLRIKLGQRLSGWVGANRQTIRNSDPILDLGEYARSTRPPLTASLSAAITTGDELIGVISLYGDIPNAFTQDHERILENVASHLGRPLQASLAQDSRSRKPDRSSGAVVVVYASVQPSPGDDGRHVSDARNDLTSFLRLGLRSTDNIRDDADDSVILEVHGLSEKDLAEISDRIGSNLSEWERVRARKVIFGCVVSSEEESGEDLVAVARARARVKIRGASSAESIH